MKTYKKLFNDDVSLQNLKEVSCKGKSGKWHQARPVQYDGGIILQIKRAWDVFIKKADALYWTIDLDN